MEREILEFFKEINQLKKSKRFSTAPEIADSSAEHSWKVALMALHLAEELKLKNLDLVKVAKLALVHDLPEYKHGDTDSLLIRLGKITKEDKVKEEFSVMKALSKKHSCGKDYFKLWSEYEEAKTQEAKFVKAVDKFETLNHMFTTNYFLKKGQIELLHGALYADKEVQAFPALKPFLKEIKKELRQQAKKANLEWKKEWDIF